MGGNQWIEGDDNVAFHQRKATRSGRLPRRRATLSTRGRKVTIWSPSSGGRQPLVGFHGGRRPFDCLSPEFGDRQRRQSPDFPLNQLQVIYQILGFFVPILHVKGPNCTF
nr:hypothetical protein Iba_chr08aCG11130 [Ipomoea batatas]